MTRPASLRRVAVTAAVALAAVLSACSGDDPEPAPTTTAPTTSVTTSTPSDSPTTTPTATATETPTATAAPTPPAGGTETPLGRDAAALAQLLPLGFPIPAELTITGDPTSTDDNANVSFTVPSGAEAFEFFQSELLPAGFEFQPGTSSSYSTEVASGAIIARGNGYDLNLLVVEDDVELTLTRTQ